MPPRRARDLLEALGYRRAEARTGWPAWTGGSTPLRVVVPLRVPHALIVPDGRGLALWDPDHILSPGMELPVLDPETLEEKGRLVVEAPGRGRLLQGSASRWDLAGPPDWWPPALNALERVLRREKPYSVLEAPVYASSGWRGRVWPEGAVWLVPAPHCGWRPLAAPWARPVCPDGEGVGGED